MKIWICVVGVLRDWACCPGVWAQFKTTDLDWKKRRQQAQKHLSAFLKHKKKWSTCVGQYTSYPGVSSQSMATACTWQGQCRLDCNVKVCHGTVLKHWWSIVQYRILYHCLSTPLSWSLSVSCQHVVYPVDCIAVLSWCCLCGVAQTSILESTQAWLTDCMFYPRTLWTSGLRRWLKAPFRKGVGSNPTVVVLQPSTGAI